MHIQVLGAHNCESKESKLVTILIDGILALDAGALTTSLSFEDQLKLKAILLTHQHYDHIRDIPAIGMNALLHETTINVYSIPAVRDALGTYLLNGKIYPDFLSRPHGNPTIKFTAIEPNRAESIEGYGILALEVNHSAPAVGYQVSSPDNKAIFYTGDAGPGLTDCWRRVSPQLLIIEVTAPDRYEEFAKEAGHFTPSLLKQELDGFRELKGYLPQVVAVHMNPGQEREIKADLDMTAKSLNGSIVLAYEGMTIHL
jgi:ribonuclease BN (tRNA processing enzyme)